MLLSNPTAALLALAMGSSSVAVTAAIDLNTAPNVIIMQPDDLHYFEDWSPPPHMQGMPHWAYPANSNFPFINRLRNDGVDMKRAYTASPKCGTSRYSTMTARYASRSAHSRAHAANNIGLLSQVSIPTTKLHDEAAVPDGNDCSTSNLAHLFKENGYKTGVVGKWHLHNVGASSVYTDVQTNIKACGFDYAEAIYQENLGDLTGSWIGGQFSHNMEYVASRAVKFIDDTAAQTTRQPFFLYANPTVPHDPAVLKALRQFDCTQTPEGTLTDPLDPVYDVPEMTGAYGGDCTAYRRSVIQRAAPSTDSADLGAIWTDDTVGAIIAALERNNELDNTIFVFQQDHGQEAKESLWENGLRILQFVHFPNGGFSPAALADGFTGVASTIDLGPTAADYAGIDLSDSNTPGYYKTDGRSWKSAIQAGKDWGSEDQCIVGEIDKDRTVVCGCDKYMRINDDQYEETYTWQYGAEYHLGFASEMLFDLCDAGTTDYTTSPGTNREETNLISSNAARAAQLSNYLDCHISKTVPTSDSPDYDTTCATSSINVVANGAACPASCPSTGSNAWACDQCAEGRCGVGIDNASEVLCRPYTWRADGKEPNQGMCPGYDEDGGECSPASFEISSTHAYKFVCHGCFSDRCVVDCDGHAVCRPKSYTPEVCPLVFDFPALMAVPATCSSPVSGTAQDECYSATSAIDCPVQGDPAGDEFYGQDAQQPGYGTSYTVDTETVTDDVTGLMWQKSRGVKVSWDDAVINAGTVAFGGHDDWRIPTIKELFSLIDFRGREPEPSVNAETLFAVPFIDESTFDFEYGADPDRTIDAQEFTATASQNPYLMGTTGGDFFFGVNFADGRIKSYPRYPPGSAAPFFVRYVRGGNNYGVNSYVDNLDDTVTDEATCLMWDKEDSQFGMDWGSALAWVETKNAMNHRGYDDWRLPSIKELQTIVDYNRSPDLTNEPAIDTSFFDTTTISNEAGQVDYPYFWSSTTHETVTATGASAAYIAFGRAMGLNTNTGVWIDVHGAGAQRSDPKSGDPLDYPNGFGPQNDAIRINNYVRLVRYA